MEIWGIPVVEREDMPKGSVILADSQSGDAVVVINVGLFATKDEKNSMKDALDKQFRKKLAACQVEYSQKVGDLAREHQKLVSMIDALPEMREG